MFLGRLVRKLLGLTPRYNYVMLRLVDGSSIIALCDSPADEVLDRSRVTVFNPMAVKTMFGTQDGVPQEIDILVGWLPFSDQTTFPISTKTIVVATTITDAVKAQYMTYVAAKEKSKVSKTPVNSTVQQEEEHTPEDDEIYH